MFGAGKPALRGVELGATLRNDRDGRGLFRLALPYLAFRALDADLRLAELRLGLAKLGFERSGIELDQDLPGSDEIALVHEHFLNPAGRLGGNVDFNRLYAAIAAGKAFGEIFTVERLPDEIGAHRDRQRRPCP